MIAKQNTGEYRGFMYKYLICIVAQRNKQRVLMLNRDKLTYFNFRPIETTLPLYHPQNYKAKFSFLLISRVPGPT